MQGLPIEIIPLIASQMNTFFEMISFFTTSKDFYQQAKYADWDKDYVNIDFVLHLHFYNRFTKVIIPLNHFKIQKENPSAHVPFPLHVKNVSFGKYLKLDEFSLYDSFVFESSKVDDSLSNFYKTFNGWINATYRLRKVTFFETNKSDETPKDYYQCYSFFYKRCINMNIFDPIDDFFGHFPSTVNSIEYNVMNAFPLEYLPPNLIELKFGNHQKLIDSSIVPSSLKMLSLGWSFNNVLNFIPKDLVYLKLSNYYNQRWINLPKTLKELILNTNFNQKIYQGTLPEELEILELGVHYEQKISASTLPSTLKIVRINNNQTSLFEFQSSEEYEAFLPKIVYKTE